MALHPLGRDSSTARPEFGGVFIGEVSTVDPDGTAAVEVPRLATEQEFPVAAHPAGYEPAVGDAVAVAFLEAAGEDVVILVRLA